MAVSDTGGRTGERRLPFIRSAESWDILEERCSLLVSEEDSEEELLETLANAASQDTSHDNRRRWGRLLSRVCILVSEKWNRRLTSITAGELEAFAEAREEANPIPELPDLNRTWEQMEERFRDGMSHRKPGAELDFDPFDDLSKFASVVKRCAPDYLKEKGFPGRYEAELAIICAEAESEARFETDDTDPEVLREISERMGSIARSVERLADISDQYNRVVPIAQRLRRQSSQFEEWAAENEPGEPDYYNESSGPAGSEVFDVQMLFSEL